MDQTEKGWFITYIDRDPETLLRNENKAKKEKMVRDDEERQAKVIAEQIERGKKFAESRQKAGPEENPNNDPGENSNENSEPNKIQEFKRENEDEKISFSIKLKPKIEKKVVPLISVKKEEPEEEEDGIEYKGQLMVEDVKVKLEPTGIKRKAKGMWIGLGIRDSKPKFEFESKFGIRIRILL